MNDLFHEKWQELRRDVNVVGIWIESSVVNHTLRHRFIVERVGGSAERVTIGEETVSAIENGEITYERRLKGNLVRVLVFTPNSATNDKTVIYLGEF